MREITRPEVLDFAPAPADMLADVLARLSRRPKRLPSRYLYDAAGAALFERICELDEYYLARTETAILADASEEIAERIGPRALVFEPGSGAGRKTKLLLSALERPAAYVPIDISREQLATSTAEMAAEFPDLEILPVCADFTGRFHLPPVSRRFDRRVAFFPGSTLGNFRPAEAVRLLRRLRRVAGPDGRLLLGVDLQKDPRILEAAYDDAEGVSAKFAMNYLLRLNRELGADFNVHRFCYSAPYNTRLGRVEMYLVSLCDQTVDVVGRRIHFRAGERMLTELSHKYTFQSIAALARRAGLSAERVWTDPQRAFCVQLLGDR